MYRIAHPSSGHGLLFYFYIYHYVISVTGTLHDCHLLVRGVDGPCTRTHTCD